MRSGRFFCATLHIRKQYVILHGCRSETYKFCLIGLISKYFSPFCLRSQVAYAVLSIQSTLAIGYVILWGFWMAPSSTRCLGVFLNTIKYDLVRVSYENPYQLLPICHSWSYLISDINSAIEIMLSHNRTRMLTIGLNSAWSYANQIHTQAHTCTYDQVWNSSIVLRYIMDIRRSLPSVDLVNSFTICWRILQSAWTCVGHLLKRQK